MINKENVVGTAIGLYLIRDTDPYLTSGPPGEATKSAKTAAKSERTFFNSHVRDYSWPCVIALVDVWTDLSGFGDKKGELHPDELVPKTLYLPDGRMVPVCVVKVDRAAADSSPVPAWHWPEHPFGGGMPISATTQGRERTATAGCLVTDGHTLYALTNRHVCGEAGETVRTTVKAKSVSIGKSSGRNLTRVAFEQVYPEFPSHRTYVNMDVGLIELDDANDSTSQIFGIGEVGPLADLNELNITLRLIDCNVVASGAASGVVHGSIKALFYRFKTVGGFDYVSDFLIAPGDSESQTRPGDSGAVWHLILPRDAGDPKQDDLKRAVAERRVRPLAVQWGGQVLVDGKGENQYAFALATNLAAICRELDVEVLLNHNTGAQVYWGQTNHYNIAAFASEAVSDAGLKAFIEANLDRISFKPGELSPDEIKAALKDARENGGLVPLADVPDIVWKQHYSKMEGGRDDRWAGPGHSTGPEHPTHFADIDQLDGNEKTLRQLCMEDENNVSVKFWQEHYTKLGHTTADKRGLLPFRVWQFYDAMVEFLKTGESGLEQFLCAAGIVAHYVGDACQPLHGSMLADGYADRPMTIVHPVSGKVEQSHEGAGVHSTYESNMIDRYAGEIGDNLSKALKKLIDSGDAIRAIASGKDAAVEVVRLMDRSAAAIPPTELVDAYIAAGGKKTVAVQDALWEEFGTATIQVTADGARLLAAIWDGAWAEGGGPDIAKKFLKPIKPEHLVAIYTKSDFVKSLVLDDVGAVLKV